MSNLQNLIRQIPALVKASLTINWIYFTKNRSSSTKRWSRK